MVVVFLAGDCAVTMARLMTQLGTFCTLDPLHRVSGCGDSAFRTGATFSRILELLILEIMIAVNNMHA